MNATVKIRLLHKSSLPGARWCEPIGWEPVNVIEGSIQEEGAWWDGNNENTAGLCWFGEPGENGHNDVVEVPLAELRVVSCGECRVLQTARK